MDGLEMIIAAVEVLKRAHLDRTNKEAEYQRALEEERKALAALQKLVPGADLAAMLGDKAGIPSVPKSRAPRGSVTELVLQVLEEHPAGLTKGELVDRVTQRSGGQASIWAITAALKKGQQHEPPTTGQKLGKDGVNRWVRKGPR